MNPCDPTEVNPHEVSTARTVIHNRNLSQLPEAVVVSNGDDKYLNPDGAVCSKSFSVVEDDVDNAVEDFDAAATVEEEGKKTPIILSVFWQTENSFKVLLVTEETKIYDGASVSVRCPQ